MRLGGKQPAIPHEYFYTAPHFSETLWSQLFFCRKRRYLLPFYFRSNILLPTVLLPPPSPSWRHPGSRNSYPSLSYLAWTHEAMEECRKNFESPCFPAGLHLTLLNSNLQYFNCHIMDFYLRSLTPEKEHRDCWVCCFLWNGSLWFQYMLLIHNHWKAGRKAVREGLIFVGVFCLFIFDFSILPSFLTALHQYYV